MSSYTVISYQGPELLKSYENLVYSKWLRSMRYGNDYFKLVDPKAYYKAYSRVINTVLSMPETTVKLAVLTDDKDVVLGFSVSRGSVLDYIHVHKDQRRLGIGTSLVPKGIETFTNVTHTGLSIWGSKYGTWKFNPFA